MAMIAVMIVMSVVVLGHFEAQMLNAARTGGVALCICDVDLRYLIPL